jgi:uncharacterized membrane protein YbhN (UPF0104 family)
MTNRRRLNAAYRLVTDIPSTRRRWLVWVLRVAVLVIVCLSVSGTVRTALRQLADYRWDFDPLWMAASAVIYVMALTPMAWFLHRTLAALGEHPAWLTTLWAYLVGHLGKYVPGKAMVIILRVGALRPHVASMTAAVVASLLETLTMMSVGACLAAVLSLGVLHLDMRLATLAVALAVVAGLPTLPPVTRWLTRLALSWRDVQQPLPEGQLPAEGNEQAMLAGITMPLLASGWLAAIVCWIGLGLSLWALLRSIGVSLDLVADLPLLVAAISLAVVAGFLSLLPSGIIVRDAILLQLLASRCGDADALLAAVLLRLVWLVSEIGICAILYVGVKGKALGARR